MNVYANKRFMEALEAPAERLGVDPQTLLRVVRGMCTRRIVSSGATYSPRPRRRWASYRYRQYVPATDPKTAARLLGLTDEEMGKILEVSKQPSWTQNDIINSLFAFWSTHGRWPLLKEFRNENGLPSQRTVTTILNNQARDGWWVRGWDAAQRIIAKDRRCTAEMALLLPNVLARREAIERIGFKRIIKSTNSVVVDQSDFGTLYRLPGETASEPMMIVAVTNSTPEPDGTHSTYYLRVPPTVKTAHEAVAWTFGMEDAYESYKVAVET